MSPGSLYPSGSACLTTAPARPAVLTVEFPHGSRGPDAPTRPVGVVEPCSHSTTDTGFLDRLRAGSSAMVRHGLLDRIAERDGGSQLVVPNAFVRDQVASRFASELRARAVELGVDRVELVVDAALPHPAPSAATKTPPAPQTRPLRARTATGDRRLPTGVVAKLLSERGYWSLSPTDRRWTCDDLKGRLVAEPSSLGGCGVPEAIVFTGLVTIWANGSRSEPVVETSLHQLASVLRLSWSGRVAELLRRSIERLKATTYRATITTRTGGVERLFSILDEIETTWTGPQASPHRHVRAVFSRTTIELVAAPRMLRPIDLDALRRLGPQRDLARRLLLFLEGSTGHLVGSGVEVVERVIDERLAATLGAPTTTPNRLAVQLDAACHAVQAATGRYRSVRVIERRKACLAPDDARFALRATRRRPTPPTTPT